MGVKSQGQTISMHADSETRGSVELQAQDGPVAVSLSFPGLVPVYPIVKHNGIPTPHPIPIVPVMTMTKT